MRRFFLALAATLLLVSLTHGPVSAESGLERFAGEWRGASLRSLRGSDGGGVTAAGLTVDIEAKSDGLKLRWSMIDWDRESGLRLVDAEAEFEPSERPAVLRATDINGDMFDDSDNGNPLAGKPMLWARADGPSLTLYTLRIAKDGSFVVDQFALELIDGGMAFDYQALSNGVEQVVLQGHLVSAGE